MNVWLITIVAGLLFFCGLYVSFDYWYQKIWLRLLEVRDETAKLADEIFIFTTPESFLKIQLGIGSGMFVLFFALLWPHIGISIPFGIAMFFLGWRLPLYYLKHIAKPARVKKFTIQMLDALTLMANGLKSGLNLSKALQVVVDEMPNPIRQEFGLILSQNRIGLTLEQGFENLGKRIETEDVQMFVTSVNILRETGGNLSETFETIVTTIRERIKLQNKISAMTAQGMTSAVVVGLMPWGIAAMLYGVDPNTMRPLFTTPVGWGILLVVLLMEAVGILVILKIVRIKV